MQGPMPPPAEARLWHEIALSVDFLTAACIACLSFFTMASLMAATPVAMSDAGRSIDASTIVIVAHIVAMYLPSLCSGHLVRHFTAPIMLVPGTLLLLLGSALLFISSENVVFFASLIILGLGWNLSYVSASSLLLAALKSPLEKPLAQAMFDGLALGGLSVAVVTSGFMFDGIGWRNMYTVRLLLCLQRHAQACHLHPLSQALSSADSAVQQHRHSESQVQFSVQCSHTHPSSARRILSHIRSTDQSQVQPDNGKQLVLKLALV